MNSRISSYVIWLIATLGLAGCGGSGTTPTKNPVVYVLDANSAPARVEVFDTSGNYLSQFSYSFSFPEGIATDSQGNVYVRDGNSNCSVDKFDSKGNFLLQIGKCGVAGGGDGPGIFDNAGQLATDASGNVWVTSPDYYNIQKYDGSGKFQELICMGNAGINNCPMATAQSEVPDNIALDAQGNIYVATNSASATPNTILKFDSSGNYVSSIGSTFSNSSQFSSPAGIAFDAAGNMYAVDSGNGRVQKFDGQGNYLSQFGSEGSGTGQFVGAPGAISIDASGNVYVTDYFGYRVLVFDSSGNYLRQFGTYGTGDGQFSGVLGVAVSR